jgi:hypothetical protein
MIIRWREFSGRPGDRLFETLHHSLGQYQEGSQSMSIGLTTDPMGTWREQRWEGWGEMVVIYSSSSHDFVRSVEGSLVAFGWGKRFTTWDYAPIGKGLPGSYTRYYVYVLLE